MIVISFTSCFNENNGKPEIISQNTPNEITEISKKNINIDKNREPAKSSTEGTNGNELGFLKSLNGLYPADSKLFDNKIFTQRIKKLLGNRYNFLMEYWAVEVPIEINNNIFVSKGCEARNCDMTNFIIVYDFSSEIMSIGVREEDVVSVYSEGEKNSPVILDWAKGF